jgi:heme/copper-type cytochrome/quinol oxidase subunit 2
MYGHMTDWGWLWMSSMTAFWIVLVGAVVYIAVKLANRDTDHRRPT